MEVKLKRVSMETLMDKKNLYEIFVQAVEMASKDGDAAEVAKLKQGLNLWTQLVMEDQAHDTKVENNVTNMQNHANELLVDLEFLLHNLRPHWQEVRY